MKRILLTLCCWLLLFSVYAQQRTVAGKVTDRTDGNVLPGVSIVVKGTTRGTVTDGNGSYSLPASGSDILVFSFIGFEQQEIAVGERTTIDIGMQASISELQEVVVIGYGEKSRAMLTESIGTINSDQITQLPLASPDAALQGRISGVQITNVDGTPGSPTSIKIRGVSTVGFTGPLFVIDGVPVQNSQVNGRFDVNPNSNILATINPSDIESISVLKDASAAAVYGVRASNGVILITTKRGKTGKPKISFDSYYGVQNFRKTYDWNTTADYVALTNAAFDNRNLQNGNTDLQLPPDLQPGSSYLGVSTDWQNEVINKNASITNSNLSISGGSEASNYYISFGYFNQEAIVKKWDLERYSLRANSDYKIGKRFRIGQTMTISYQNLARGANNGGDGFLFAGASNLPPFFSIYEDPNNPIPGNRYGFNGNNGVAGLSMLNIVGMNELLRYRDQNYRMLGGLYGELDIIKGLTFRSAASIDFGYSNNTGWNPGYTTDEIGLARPQNFGDSRGQDYTQVFTQTLTYGSTVGHHSFNVMAGFEYQKQKNSYVSPGAGGFISTDPAYYESVKNGATNRTLGGGVGNMAYVGYIGRASYDFKSKYLITFSVRRDGTASFAPENRYGTFPAVSAAWRLSQEDFIAGIPFINELKLRGSWGQLGNSRTTQFAHQNVFSATPDYAYGNTTIQTPVPFLYINKNLIWETVETTDLGFDVSMFNNKVSLLATYYDKTTKDFLYSLPIPSITGFSSIPVNAGKVNNRGIEIELGYEAAISNDLTINIAANITTVKNRLLELSPGIQQFTEGGNYRTAVGYPIGYYYGYKMLGIYQNQAQADGALPDQVSGQDPRPGDVIFEDNNGPADADAPAGVQFSGSPDGEITTHDRTYLGKSIPGYFYGLSIGANYKGFDLNIFFQGQGDYQIYNQFRQNNLSLNGLQRNNLAASMDYWTGENSTNTMPRPVQGDPSQNNRFSNRWVEDGDFLRLKNVQLGYTFPSSLLEKTKTFSRARIYVAASNLFVITDYSGLDPEVMTYGSSNNALQQGNDQGNIPQPRIIQAGIQLEF